MTVQLPSITAGWLWQHWGHYARPRHAWRRRSGAALLSVVQQGVRYAAWLHGPVATPHVHANLRAQERSRLYVALHHRRNARLAALVAAALLDRDGIKIHIWRLPNRLTALCTAAASHGTVYLGYVLATYCTLPAHCFTLGSSNSRLGACSNTAASAGRSGQHRNATANHGRAVAAACVAACARAEGCVPQRRDDGCDPCVWRGPVQGR